MNIETERIVKVLDALMEVCGLDKSERATEEPCHILLAAFSQESAKEMRQEIAESHQEGLCLDMRWSIAKKIMEAAGINPFSSN